MNLTQKEFSDTLAILTDFEPECRVLCAFSGGCDSLALLVLLTKTLGPENVVALYVNHNLRDEEELVKEIELNSINCKNLGLSLVVKTIEKNIIEANAQKYGGTEAYARSLRYSILQQAARDYDCSFIATAHHYDDQMETLLMKVVNKAPITAIRGIGVKNGNIIRPLLEFSKNQIEAFVKAEGLKYSTDSTNTDNSYKRNWIRNQIIPQMASVMPDWEKRLQNLQSYALRQCQGTYCYKGYIELSELKTLTRAQALMAIYSLWDSTIDTMMPQTLFERVYSSLDEDFKIVSANGGSFCIYENKIYLKNDALDLVFENFEAEIKMQDQQCFLPGNLCLKRVKQTDVKQLCLDWSLFEGTVKIRFVRQGDRIELKDGSKTVLKLLQDQKVAPVFRKRVPVLEDKNGICAVFGSVFGGKDRIALKMRSYLAPLPIYSYIITEG